MIRHRQGEYPVKFISIASLQERLPKDHVVITDENVNQQWSDHMGSAPRLVLPAGESTKSLKVFGRALAWMAQQSASRKTAVVAVGGGVVGDLAGFVAASYMRGVPFIQVPTTIVSQVDSSVGGKVGIDLEEGKNLAGAFYQPSAVYIPLECLQTLPERQFINGMAEVWKYAFIMDRPFLDLLTPPITVDSTKLKEVVERCIALKAQVVEEDEYETSGRRAILNFGHTIGHAIEALTGYGPVLHGEGVSIGMVAESRLGELLGLTPKGTTREVERLLSSQGLPINHPILQETDALIDLMRRDKKSVKRSLTFSLLTELGACKLVENVPEEKVRAALRTP